MRRMQTVWTWKILCILRFCLRTNKKSQLAFAYGARSFLYLGLVGSARCCALCLGGSFFAGCAFYNFSGCFVFNLLCVCHNSSSFLLRGFLKFVGFVKINFGSSRSVYAVEGVLTRAPVAQISPPVFLYRTSEIVP